jgi:hypothetical protein
MRCREEKMQGLIYLITHVTNRTGSKERIQVGLSLVNRKSAGGNDLNLSDGCQKSLSFSNSLVDE